MDTTTSEYRASAFAPGEKGKILAGKLAVLPGGIEFRTSTGVSLVLTNFHLRRDGHNGQQIFFEDAGHPGWSIYSSDPELLKDPLLLATPEFATVLRQADKVRRKIPFPVFAGIAVALLLLVALATLFLVKDWIVEAISNRIPIKWEQSFGDSAFEQIKSQGQNIENSAWDPQLRQITSRLEKSVGITGYNFRFHISKDTNVNAFALPGGNVVILTGLLEQAASGEEIAGVLAHEMAHVARRHSLRTIVQTAGLGVLVQAFFGDTSGLFAVLGEGSQYLLQQKFSRNFEREADDAGWKYLLDAQIDPRGMIQFFEKLKKIEQHSGAELNGTLALLSTHPATEERIEYLNQKWDATRNHPQFVPLPPWHRLE